MLKELIESGFGNRMNLCCSEKILYGANWAYNLQLPPEALKMSAGFGGGMGKGFTCGGITGGIMVLSALYVKRNNHESSRIRELEQEYIDKFQAALGAVDCKDLKVKHPPVVEKRQCNIDLILTTAAGILDEIVEREGLV